MSELLELGETFKQAMKELVEAWLVRLWGMAADGTSLSAAETKPEQYNFLSLLY